MNKQTVLIVGGGASGALLAANLTRVSPDSRVVVIEPRADVGKGMAYSTACPLHLLNVPAAKMSAFPDEPAHFLLWLRKQGFDQYTADSFVPRQIYGRYLNSLLDNSPVTHVRAKAMACRVTPENDRERVELQLSNGQKVTGDSLVLATGNAAPAPWPTLPPDVIESGRFFPIVWESGALRPANTHEPILLLGSGLTAVDAVLELRHNGHRGLLLMISRRGLLPQPHRLFHGAALPFAGAASSRLLVRQMHAAARKIEQQGGNWRIAVDGVRPDTNRIWAMLNMAEQRRFLRHVRAYWDVHRHRMAPAIAAEIQSLMGDGSLQVLAGRAGEIVCGSDGLQVQIKPRGKGGSLTLRVGRIINCTGPEANLERLHDPLVRDLIEQGILTSHPLRTGADVDADGALIDRNRHSSPTFYAIGPLRMGRLIETVAMPEIREQARDLARTLDRRARCVPEDSFASLAS